MRIGGWIAALGLQDSTDRRGTSPANPLSTNSEQGETPQYQEELSPQETEDSD
jgi:hypothetical protein